MSALAKTAPEAAALPAGKAAVSLGELEHQAAFLLRIAQLAAFERFFALLGDSPFSSAELTVLVAIERNPGIRQGEIADVLKIKWPNMTKLVRAMESRGLVERHIPPHDRRSVVLRITEAGRAAIAQSSPAMGRADREAMSMLDDAEHAQLMMLSRKIAGWPPVTASPPVSEE
jgi:DNA-binding MarR family transcriptional regulator